MRPPRTPLAMSLAQEIPSVLIANRGEIALRIVRTLKRLGIRAIAIHHEIDAEAPHVRAADEAHLITGDTPTAAHLDIAQIVATARRSGARAVHPGYGFLAENAGFAEAVAEAGMRFVGPAPAAIRLMGDKVVSREFVARHGFPLAPSVATTGDAAALREAARDIGFPLLIKAAAGGGGKGMQIVRDADSFAAAFALARSEAQRYFADARVYCEKYLERPRHIEVQILADTHGDVLHLGERECSVQRRFQKIVEETPSPGLDAALRARICETAVAIAAAAGYTNAGTVEFILGDDGAFYFLEMNTRLQVEHPVTEMVTGLDLVEQQLRVAAGFALDFVQSDVRASGHAIELRICAEDTEGEFLPATGRIGRMREPAGAGVRLDSALFKGTQVTSAFDPMLAKLIVHGADRADAIAKARAALHDYVILGVTTNIGFLSRVLGHPAFAAGDTHTHFIPDHREALRRVRPEPALERALIAVAALQTPDFRRQAFGVPSLHAAMGAWRNA
jgi:propionyl-CoA carboxylase alpha chain/3-methylcrotonyl-CoA carboxylase alpha subunit/acetyl-CoA/propionyl-CoA carboxylase biotin carboxyl carrier protein